jgi:hypothetical protein
VVAAGVVVGVGHWAGSIVIGPMCMSCSQELSSLAHLKISLATIPLAPRGIKKILKNAVAIEDRRDAKESIFKQAFCSVKDFRFTFGDEISFHIFLACLAFIARPPISPGRRSCGRSLGGSF